MARLNRWLLSLFRELRFHDCVLLAISVRLFHTPHPGNGQRVGTTGQHWQHSDLHICDFQPHSAWPLCSWHMWSHVRGLSLRQGYTDLKNPVSLWETWNKYPILPQFAPSWEMLISLLHTFKPPPHFIIWGVSALLHLVPPFSKHPVSAEVIKGHPEGHFQPTDNIICLPPKEFP